MWASCEGRWNIDYIFAPTRNQTRIKLSQTHDLPEIQGQSDLKNNSREVSKIQKGEILLGKENPGCFQICCRKRRRRNLCCKGTEETG